LLKRIKYKSKPLLKDCHKQAQIEFCRFNIDRGERWKNVVFSDEKKFNLDGPDGYQYYWHDISNTNNFLSKDCHNKKSLMIWGAFDYFGKSMLYFFKQNINSNTYIGALESHLLPFFDSLELDEIVFQQDNARPHVSSTTLEWLERRGIETLDWPAYSPDLNPIENLWGVLVQRVYANGRVYDNINDLKISIKNEWERIPKNILENLVTSMKTRIFDVLLSGGSNTKY